MPPSLKNVLSSEYFLNHFSSRASNPVNAERNESIKEVETAQLERNTESGMYMHIRWMGMVIGIMI